MPGGQATPGGGCRVEFTVPLASRDTFRVARLAARDRGPAQPPGPNAPKPACGCRSAANLKSFRMKPAHFHAYPPNLSLKPLLRVALVEDQPEIRENWKRLIESFRGFQLVCTCSSGRRGPARDSPGPAGRGADGIFLPRMSGIECTARLKALLPKTRSSF